MSYAAEKWARQQKTGNARAKAVLLELANCLNGETGKCCPSLDHICEVTELQRHTVISAIKSLVEKGFIEKTLITTKKGRASQYRLLGFTGSVKNDTTGSVKTDTTLTEHSVEIDTMDSVNFNTTGSVKNDTRTSNTEQVNRTSNKKEDGGETFALSPSKDNFTKNQKQNSRGTSFTLETIPEDWIKVSQKLAPDLDPQKLFEEFSDYWKAVPGERGRKKDWLATFRNHVRNLPDWKRKNFRKTNSYREPETREPDFSKIDYGESGLLSDFKF